MAILMLNLPKGDIYRFFTKPTLTIPVFKDNNNNTQCAAGAGGDQQQRDGCG